MQLLVRTCTSLNSLTIVVFIAIPWSSVSVFHASFFIFLPSFFGLLVLANKLILQLYDSHGSYFNYLLFFCSLKELLYFSFRDLHKTHLWQWNNFYVNLNIIASMIIKVVQTYVRPLISVSVEEYLLLTWNSVYIHSHKKQIVRKHRPNWPFYTFMFRTKLY